MGIYGNVTPSTPYEPDPVSDSDYDEPDGELVSMFKGLMAQDQQLKTEGPDNRGLRCPDTGACGHRCDDVCWRSRFCDPLSIYGDNWPEDCTPVAVAVMR